MNAFVYPREKYKRDINVIKTFVEDTTLFLHKATGKPIDQCKGFVTTNLKSGGKFELKDPPILYLERKENGDKEKLEGTFTQYLKDVTEKKRIIAPTMTCYLHPDEKKSLIAKYIDGNVGKRKKFKKAMFVAKMQGDAMLQAYNNNLQNTCKIKNNSVSGAHASPYTILYNKSSHSTLTSTCRCATSYANAHNEKFLMGNRFYWNPKVTLANIVSIVSNADYSLLQPVMIKYNLHYPTFEDTMECIIKSTRKYWEQKEDMVVIERLVAGLTPLERAAFVYTADLFHLAKHNRNVLYTFFFNMIQRDDTPIANPDSIIDNLSSDMRTMVSLLCSDVLAGRLMDDVKKNAPNDYAVIANNAKRLTETLSAYDDLIAAVWRPTTLLPTIYNIRGMQRECVALSDTDSTVFSVEYWTEWFTGKYDFSKDSCAVSYVATFLTSQIVIHLLAMYSANLGVEQKQIHKLTMKNEYAFPVLVTTPRSKHYFALRSAQEGNVFKEMDMEVKGVELITSNAPPQIMQRLEDYMRELMLIIMKNNQLTVDEILGPVVAIENEIRADILNGGFKYMRTMQIRDSGSYVDGENAANYQHYHLWRDVFGDKYGHTTPPPYASVKVSVALEKPVAMKRWLDSIQDRVIAEKLTNWFELKQKKDMTNFLLPLEIIDSTGIPPEIVLAIDIRQLIFNIMKPYYLVLEAFGFYMTNTNNTRLLSDQYPPRQ